MGVVVGGWRETIWPLPFVPVHPHPDPLPLLLGVLGERGISFGRFSFGFRALGSGRPPLSFGHFPRERGKAWVRG